MSVLLVVIGGAVTALVLALGKRAPSAPPKAPVPAPPPKATGGGVDIGDAGKGLGEVAGIAGSLGVTAAGAGLAVAAVAEVAGGAALGHELTHDTAGTVAGGLNFYVGNSVNVGREVGRAIDQAFGGTGETNTATGLVAQVGGGAVGGAWAVFGFFAAIAFIEFVALVWAVVEIIDDALALGRGQVGALTDYWSQWDSNEAWFRHRLWAGNAAGIGYEGVNPLTGNPWANDDEVRRFSWPLADGWMRQQNRLRFAEWMTRGRGLTINESDFDHARFGRDRGHFCGDWGPGNVLMNEPPLKSWTLDYENLAKSQPGGAQLVPVKMHRVMASRWRLVRKPGSPSLPDWMLYTDAAGVRARPVISSKEFITVEASGDVVPTNWRPGPGYGGSGLASIANAPTTIASGNSYFSGQAASSGIDLGDGLGQVPNATLKVSDFYSPTVELQFDDYTGYRDTLGPSYVTAGCIMANLYAWQDWMANHAPDPFQSDMGHAKNGSEHGWFEGTIEDGGQKGPLLIWGGRAIDKTGAVVEVRDPNASPADLAADLTVSVQAALASPNDASPPVPPMLVKGTVPRPVTFIAQPLPVAVVPAVVTPTLAHPPPPAVNAADKLVTDKLLARTKG